MQEPHTIAIIGAGAIGRHHAEATEELAWEGTDLRVFDPSEDALQGFLRAHKQATPCSDLDTCLNAPRGGGIAVIATPPLPRAEIIAQALRRGWHVLAEKPLTMTSEEAERIGAIARAEQRYLRCCDCRFLEQPFLKEAKRRIFDGSLGKIYRVVWRAREARSRTGIEWQPETRWFLSKSKNGGGIVMDWGPYDLAVLHDLFQPTSATFRHAWMAQPETALPADLRPEQIDVEFHAGARIDYQTALGSIPVDYERSACLHGPAYAQFLIEGSQGSLELDWTFNPALQLHYDVKMKPAAKHLSSEVDGLHFHHRPLYFMARDIAAGVPVEPLAQTSVFNMSVLHAFYEAAESQQTLEVYR